ncbi:multicomponent Na+:H+ antiporter subunit E [Paenibacillus sp. UNCCL117]|uniref:Na+/H+ antiporter subunit E n=1 Tax=unclassified Paenibacillus TaxID=185978 RepID=UPI0008910215|nr:MULTISPECIES: Na+/H+ antiporter subunit E [unclassified Paenibacillus]SDC18278.1 multisubunit sodium/proton antiporter, MrpE subunit [Paenibacillus sp. cl123]SFW18174.1 multicomponent Na+:H+ antiporter subunit E [Paenibacillus sp. UNCCL117]
MALQLLLNLMIAAVWMFLQNEWSAAQFIVGFLVGAGCIGLLRRFWPHDFYLRRLWAVLKLLALFAKELIASSIAVSLQLLRPKLAIRPGIFAYKTELKSDWEITVLSCLICLTPGTLTLDVSPDGQTLYIHALDIEDSEQLSGQIKETFEQAIMEVTRS